GGDDAIAHLQVGHAGADALDDSCDFRSRRKREGRLDLVLALDHQDVEEIQRRCLDRNDSLARPRHRIGHIRQHEIGGLAVLRAEDGFHGRTWSSQVIGLACFMPDLQPGYNGQVRDCERSKAIQLYCSKESWIASSLSLLAMTGKRGEGSNNV